MLSSNFTLRTKGDRRVTVEVFLDGYAMVTDCTSGHSLMFSRFKNENYLNWSCVPNSEMNVPSLLTKLEDEYQALNKNWWELVNEGL